KLYAEAREREQELKKELEETRPFTNLGRIVLAQSGSVSMQSAAHFLCQHGFETGQNRLFRLFREKKLLCSRKGRQWNQPTQKAIEQGLLNTEISGGFRAVAMVTP
ncbi:MAG: phage antirepressor KilAC domain-containing protein, partial [Synergistaceae bacterium]|nr:phage antirepressor KilAC domain-containing protein [Synergistaceae bacterium]